MVSLFDKTNKMKNSNSNKPMSLTHQEFLKRIKKSLYYGPSRPNNMISHPLASMVSQTFSSQHRNYSLKTLELDSISRIRQQTPCSLILTIIYLERLNKLDPMFVKTISPSELFLVTLMVSTKFYSDYDELEVFASAWAEEGGIDVQRLKQLEMSFLNAIQFNLMVSQNEFFEKLKTVERLLAMKEGLSRGWFTYTELELLMPTVDIAKRILNYTTVLMFSYACSIATIALSSIILASIPPMTDLAVQTNLNSSTSTSLITIDKTNYDIEMDYEPMLNPMELDVNFTRNYTINVPLFNRIVNGEIKNENRDFSNFPLVARKYDPVPLRW